MPPLEPSQEWQSQTHQRILADEPTAFAELCEVALEHLVHYLAQAFPNYEKHVHQTISIDLLLSYQTTPNQYDPNRLPLFGYLRMAARRDMLNEISKQERQANREVDIDDPDVELRLGTGNTIQEVIELEEWLGEITDIPSAEILETVRNELDETEQKILQLMIDGERSSTRFAETLGVSNLDELSQRLEAKRAKDRVKKKLQRLGKRIRRK